MKEWYFLVYKYGLVLRIKCNLMLTIKPIISKLKVILSSYSHLLSPRGVNQYVYNTHFIFHLIYAPFSLGKNRIARHWSISVLLLYLNFYSFDRYRESPLYFVLLFVSSVHLWCFPIITIPPSFLVPLGIKTPLYILIT